MSYAAYYSLMESGFTDRAKRKIFEDLRQIIYDTMAWTVNTGQRWENASSTARRIIYKYYLEERRKKRSY